LAYYSSHIIWGALLIELCVWFGVMPMRIGCYPFDVTDDPFVLTEAPHIYFASNQPEYATRLVEGKDGQLVRLVMVPSFATTRTIVLVNLNDLSCTPVQFGIHGSQTGPITTTNSSSSSSPSSSSSLTTLATPAAPSRAK
jgi:hypothetical protein